MIKVELRTPTHSPITEWEENEVVIGEASEAMAKGGAESFERHSSALACSGWNRLAGTYQSDEELWRWTGPWDM